jgi:hypothetical protein
MDVTMETKVSAAWAGFVLRFLGDVYFTRIDGHKSDTA